MTEWVVHIECDRLMDCDVYIEFDLFDDTFESILIDDYRWAILSFIDC